jgi:hypothetical protein
MDESTTTMRLPGAAARRFGHACGFFHSQEEEYRVLLPLAKEGFERGENDDLVVCAYDLTKFSAGVMMDVLRTHPLVIIGGFLHENPFFVPPDELLGELHARDRSNPKS